MLQTNNPFLKIKTRVTGLRKNEVTFIDMITNDPSMPMDYVQISESKNMLCPHMPNDQFFHRESTKKTKIVIDFSECELEEAFRKNLKSTGCSVNFLVARNGAIIEMFDSKYWSSYFTKPPVGGSSVSKGSIGISLIGYGKLDFYSPLNLLSIPNCKKKGENVYCFVTDKNSYIKLDVPFRGCSYFTRPTEDQLSALGILLDYLCEKHGIPKRVLPENERNSVFRNPREARNYSGITFAANYGTSDEYAFPPGYMDSLFGEYEQCAPERVFDTEEM